MNSKCVQSKRKCESHESCVYIAGFSACGCQKKSVMYETECRHVAVPLEVSRTRTIYSIETHTSDFIFNTHTHSLSLHLFFLLQNCRPSDELSFSVYGPSSLYCLRGSSQFMMSSYYINKKVFKQNPKSRI